MNENLTIYGDLTIKYPLRIELKNYLPNSKSEFNITISIPILFTKSKKVIEYYSIFATSSGIEADFNKNTLIPFIHDLDVFPNVNLMYEYNYECILDHIINICNQANHLSHEQALIFMSHFFMNSIQLELGDVQYFKSIQ